MKASRLLLEKENYCIYRCGNGLIDGATRVVVQGRHVANIYTGQLFLESPDLDFFRERARMHGFDETAYLDAIQELPVISEELLRCVMEYLSSFAELLGELGYREISLIAAKEELEKTVIELENTQQVLIGSIEELKNQFEIVNEKEEIAHQHEELWEYAVEGTGLIVYDWNVKSNQLYFTKTFKALLGFEATEFTGDREEYINRVHPDDRKKLKEVADACLEGSTGIYRNEYRIKDRYGKYIWVLANGKIVERDQHNKPVRLVGTITDITKYYEQDDRQPEGAYDKGDLPCCIKK